jgi:hypothetical protein
MLGGTGKAVDDVALEVPRSCQRPRLDLRVVNHMTILVTLDKDLRRSRTHCVEYVPSTPGTRRRFTQT